MSQYYVDQNDISEMSRLLKQSNYLITMFGGLLADRPDFAGIHRVLDIACGPGEWATEVARQHPDIQVVGMDISKPMIDFAQAKAYQDQLETLAFELRDATQLPLPYEEGAFDLVNASLIYAFMTRDLWPRLIKDCARVLSLGGFLRVIQEDAHLITNSPAMAEYHRLGSLALYKAGQSYYPDYLGVIPRLRGMFEAAGIQVVTQRHYIIDVSNGTEGYRIAYEDYKVLLGLLRPFLVKWQVATVAEADALYERCLKEMQHGIQTEQGEMEKYTAFWHFSSVFGKKEDG
jgi:ubiquinone/menaquinone biosynthesis C-methylase UbiE